jgi:hypothetical protein
MFSNEQDLVGDRLAGGLFPDRGGIGCTHAGTSTSHKSLDPTTSLRYRRTAHPLEIQRLPSPISRLVPWFAILDCSLATIP